MGSLGRRCFPPASTGVLERGLQGRCQMCSGGWLQPKPSRGTIWTWCRLRSFPECWAHPARGLSQSDCVCSTNTLQLLRSTSLWVSGAHEHKVNFRWVFSAAGGSAGMCVSHFTHPDTRGTAHTGPVTRVHRHSQNATVPPRSWVAAPFTVGIPAAGLGPSQPSQCRAGAHGTGDPALRLQG